MKYNKYGNYDSYDYRYTTPYMQGEDESMMVQQPQPGDKFSYPQNFTNALDLIEHALSGETEDRAFYTWLIGQADSEDDRQIISGIRDDEIGHYALFKQLFYELTGIMPQPAPGEQFVPPESYCDGLSHALMGEQNAVQKYRKILYAMQYPEHINMMIEIITDEIRHGILYSYLYSKNGCTS